LRLVCASTTEKAARNSIKKKPKARSDPAHLQLQTGFAQTPQQMFISTHPFCQEFFRKARPFSRQTASSATSFCPVKSCRALGHHASSHGSASRLDLFANMDASHQKAADAAVLGA
jgi:hypothetical protein